MEYPYNPKIEITKLRKIAQILSTPIFFHKISKIEKIFKKNNKSKPTKIIIITKWKITHFLNKTQKNIQKKKKIQKNFKFEEIDIQSNQENTI